MRFECRVRTSSSQQVKCNWRARAQWSQTGSYLQDVRCKTKQIPEWSSSMKPGIVKIERNKTYSQRNKKVIRCFDTNIVVWSRKTREQQIKFRRLQQSLHSPPFSPPPPPLLGNLASFCKVPWYLLSGEEPLRVKSWHLTYKFPYPFAKVHEHNHKFILILKVCPADCFWFHSVRLPVFRSVRVYQ